MKVLKGVLIRSSVPVMLLSFGLAVLMNGCRRVEPATTQSTENQADKQPARPVPAPVPHDASPSRSPASELPPKPVPHLHHARQAQGAAPANHPDDDSGEASKTTAAEAKGVMNFDPPSTMNLNVGSPVDVAIRRPADAPIALIPSDDDAKNKYGLTGNGPVQGVEVPVSDVMDVELRARDSAAFTITPSDDQRKSVEPGGHAEWHWTVTPLKAGQQELLLHSMRIRMLANGRALPPTDDDTKVATITVTVLPWTERIGPATGKFLAENWKSILAYLVPGGAGAGILAGWWKKRKKKSSKSAPTQG